MEEVLVGFGLKLPVVPEGNPLTDRVTGELNPFVGFTVTVVLTVPPFFPIVTVDGLSESE